MNLRLFLARKLTGLARWMPARLRARFEDEIEAVLSEHLQAAGERGWAPFLSVILGELLQFPGLHLRQRLSPAAQGGVMLSARFDSILADEHPPTPWGWALVALFPFFFSWIYWLFAQIMALAGFARNSDQPLAMLIFSYSFFTLVVLVSVALVAAWTRGFPTWSYTIGFLFFVFSLYVGNASMPGLTLFGYQFGRRILGAFALIPLGAVVIVSLFLTRKNLARPFLKGFNDLSQDFSRASFGIYGLIPFFLRLIFDEVHEEEYFLMVVDLFLAGCALVYLRARRTAIGMGALAGSLVLVFSISTIYLAVYWNGRQEEWMPAPASGWESLVGSLTCLIPALIFCLGPWLIHLLNRHEQSG